MIDAWKNVAVREREHRTRLEDELRELKATIESGEVKIKPEWLVAEHVGNNVLKQTVGSPLAPGGFYQLVYLGNVAFADGSKG